MNRTLKIERVYPLGDYKNIKLTDEFVEIPDHISTNTELINKLYNVLMMTCDLQYFQYARLWKENNGFSNLDEAISKLNNLIENTMSELQVKFKNGHSIE